MRTEQYSETEELLHRYSLHVDFINYGKPISAKVFDLEFPPETYVTNNIEEKEYQVSYPLEENQEKSYVRWIVWTLINMVIFGWLFLEFLYGYGCFVKNATKPLARNCEGTLF